MLTKLLTYSRSTGLLGKLFGSTPEPVDRFHQYWLGELASAGY